MHILTQKRFATLFALPLCIQATELNDIFNEGFDEQYVEIEAEFHRRARCSPAVEPSFIINQLVDTLNLPGILAQGLYIRTNPTNVRNVLDEPSLHPYTYETDCWGIAIQGFFNQMRHAYFTEHSPCIRSYINITNPDLLEEIDIDLFKEVDAPAVLPLFGGISLEQRRLGFMASVHKKFEEWAITAILPLYWFEQNFFLSNNQVQRVQDQPIFQNAGTNTTQSGAQAFFEKHVVSTKLGFGDFRFQLSKNLQHREGDQWYFGLELTLPTAVAFNGDRITLWLKDFRVFGLFGGKYGKHCPRPTLNFNELFCLALNGDTLQQEQAIAQITNLGVKTLDFLTATVADEPLGQRFVGIAPFMTYDQCLYNRLHIQGYAALEYLVPRTLTRMFLVDNNPQIFDPSNFQPESEEQAQEMIDFLAQKTLEFLYPTALDVHINPGLLVKAYSNLAYTSDWFHIAGGLDIWYKTAEHFDPRPGAFKFSAGESPAAFQLKFFSRIYMTHFRDWTNIKFGLRGEGALCSFGIGKDWLITADVALDF
jgi:hypothetical protein